MNNKPKILSRQELYDLVWGRPGRDVARELGMSDVALGKACKRANVPRPGVGYWAKKAAGKPSLRPPLPERGLGQSDEIRIGGGQYRFERPTDEENSWRSTCPATTLRGRASRNQGASSRARS